MACEPISENAWATQHRGDASKERESTVQNTTTKHNALHPILTGSGSACFSVCRTTHEARQLAASLEAAGWPYVVATRLAPRATGTSPLVIME